MQHLAQHETERPQLTPILGQAMLRRGLRAPGSHREEETPPANELLETMKAMQKQLDELKKEKGEATHRRRRRSPFARAMSTIKNQKRFARLKEAKNTLTSAC